LLLSRLRARNATDLQPYYFLFPSGRFGVSHLVRASPSNHVRKAEAISVTQSEDFKGELNYFQRSLQQGSS
jgi:hypothetical protein